MKNKKSYTPHRHQRNIPTKKLLIGLVSFALFGLVAALALPHLSSQNNTAVQSTTEEKLDLSPPTAEDKKATEQNKDDLAKQLDGQNKEGTTAPVAPVDENGKKQAQVSISSASQNNESVRIAAFVSNVFEEGGTCSLTISKGTSTINRTSEGFQNASYTQCTPFTISRSEFATTGSWTATVHYSSTTSAGKSTPTPVEVK
ncbi:MAG TPA: hypothetical protein VK983_05750 [Candidatus Limnocylindrales bacterium]|nr:hypothetical protein [Candidatus Limnocylindrales bacterium]